VHVYEHFMLPMEHPNRINYSCSRFGVRRSFYDLCDPYLCEQELQTIQYNNELLVAEKQIQR
jgi:hypothetical protein